MSRDEQATLVSQLRHAAEECIVLLGTGFLRHPSNAQWVQRLHGGELSATDYYAELRVQLLQLTAWTLGELEGAVPQPNQVAARRYFDHYCTERLRLPATHQHPDSEASAWLRCVRVLRALWQSDRELAVVAWGSQLFDPVHTSNIRELQLADDVVQSILEVARNDLVLPCRSHPKIAHLRTQVLGTLHEWLLEQQLEMDLETRTVRLVVRPGHQRRTTGSYFTPPALVQNLLDVCLEPGLNECLSTASPGTAQQRLLALRIVDPSCGTGVFLSAVAQRLLQRLNSAGQQSNALSEIISKCLYGVDIDSTAVQLCRLILWLQCGPPFEPLPLIDQHIQCGNSIFGAFTGFETRGISNSAFEPGPEDDAPWVNMLKLRNRSERKAIATTRCGDGLATAPGATHAAPASQQAALADLWCAVYVWPKRSGIDVPTHADFVRATESPASALERWQVALTSIVQRYRFFHWHLQFAEVFSGVAGSELNIRKGGGFDFVVGNPPWVAHAGRSTQRLPSGHKQFLIDNFAAFAGYPTTHGVFVELAARLLNANGRIGLVLPASVADLDGYAPARKSHDELCVLTGLLPDYGEGQFAGVTQPSIALISQRRSAPAVHVDLGKPWALERSDLDTQGLALLDRMARTPTLPHELFGERGFQSTPTLRRHISKQERPTSQFSLALREGTDIRECFLGSARHYADPCLFKMGLRPLNEFSRVGLVVRQTARYPIVAKNDGAAFRNSLLAVVQHDDWSWPVMLCLLNSSLIRWNHYYRFRDGRQPILPQLKVGHLRSIPAPASRSAVAFARLEKVGIELAAHNRGIEVDERELIDACVAELYGLSGADQRMVTDWHRARPG